MTSNLFTCIVLAVALCLCQGCGSQKGPIDQEEKAYRALLVDGNRLLRKAKYEEALSVFAQAVARMPDKAEGYLNRGIAYVVLKQYEKAIGDFDEAIFRDKTLAIAYANRGIAYDHLGKYKEALADYKEALALDPNKVKGPGFMERFLYNKPKTPDVRERAAFLEKTLIPQSEDQKPS
jgi:tetratricopeptide (TPR) repeat protein